MSKEIKVKFTDSSGQKRRGVVRTCPVCKQEFVSRYQDGKATQKYCSIQCRGKGKQNRVEVQCAYCCIYFYKKVSKLKLSKSKFYFCSRQCKDKGQSLKGGIKEIMPPHYGTGSIDYRALFTPEELYCRRCGYKEFDCSVQVHHIDKDRNNNSKENLYPLCANCHWALHKNKWIFKKAN
jgi:hypothetical protein